MRKKFFLPDSVRYVFSENDDDDGEEETVAVAWGGKWAEKAGEERPRRRSSGTISLSIFP